MRTKFIHRLNDLQRFDARSRSIDIGKCFEVHRSTGRAGGPEGGSVDIGAEA